MPYYRLTYRAAGTMAKTSVIPAQDETAAREIIKSALDTAIITKCAETNGQNFIMHLTGRRLQLYEALAIDGAIDKK